LSLGDAPPFKTSDIAAKMPRNSIAMKKRNPVLITTGVDKVAFPPIIIGEKLLKIRGWGRISAQGRVKNLLKAGKSQTDLICLNHWGNNTSLGRPI